MAKNIPEYSNKKYIPIVIFLTSALFTFFLVSYRKQDWVTGGLLLSICTPALFLELITVIGFFLTKKGFWKRIFIVIESTLALGIILFYLIYITKYN